VQEVIEYEDGSIGEGLGGCGAAAFHGVRGARVDPGLAVEWALGGGLLPGSRDPSSSGSLLEAAAHSIPWFDSAGQTAAATSSMVIDRWMMDIRWACPFAVDDAVR